MKVFVSLVGIVALLGSAFAQAPKPQFKTQHRPGKVGPLSLLLRPYVRADLKMSKDAAEKIDAMLASKKQGEGYRFAPGEVEEFESKLVALLNASQKRRLEQLLLQEEGYLSLTASKTAKAVGLTEGQKKDIEKISNGYDFDLRKAYEGTDDREEMMANARAAKEKANGRIEKLLTAEQKKKWLALTGAPIKRPA